MDDRSIETPDTTALVDEGSSGLSSSGSHSPDDISVAGSKPTGGGGLSPRKGPAVREATGGGRPNVRRGQVAAKGAAKAGKANPGPFFGGGGKTAAARARGAARKPAKGKGNKRG
jgi:hypothetical protein